MIRKVILNGCYGGYGWSKQGVLEVLKAKGFHDLHCMVGGEGANWMKYDEIPEEDFVSNNRSWYVSIGNDTDSRYSKFDREDPEAIAILEKFGSDFCSDKHADLYIDEFDDEFFDYDIDEYDGIENLRLKPSITREQVLACNSVADVADLLEKIGVIRKVTVEQ